MALNRLAEKLAELGLVETSPEARVSVFFSSSSVRLSLKDTGRWLGKLPLCLVSPRSDSFRVWKPFG